MDAFLVRPLIQGIFEFHTAVVPDGRGSWANQFFKDGLDWMFTQTNAVELLTKVPLSNVGAKFAVKSCGFSMGFPSHFNGEQTIVYSMTIQNWAHLAEILVPKGQWFHRELEQHYRASGKTINHDDDPTHDRYVGGTVAMIQAGFPQKAVSFYNRWALMSDYQPISVVSSDPLIFDIQESRIRVVNNTFEVM